MPAVVCEASSGGEAVSMKNESEDEVHEEFTYINGAITQILKCGPWKNLWNNESTPKVLFLVIPGNPGLPGFYRTFIQTLYCNLKQQYPVWVVSHAGHCNVPHGMKMTEDSDNSDRKDIFGLCGQIEHKLSFLRKNVPKDVKLVLIGHSIGCYISLQVMKLAPELQIFRGLHLFPTIERMARSPQGKILTPLLCYLRYFLYILTYLVTLFPERVKKYIVQFVMKDCCNDKHSLTTIVDMLRMDCLVNIFYLASQEMRIVKERDSSTIRKHLKKLTFYHGEKDLWCPVQYYEEMKMDFPDGDIRLCERGIRHAFVLWSAKEMADLVTDWVWDDLARL